MTQRYQRVAIGVFAACIAAIVGAACGGDDKGADQNVGEQGGSGGGDSGSGGSSAGADSSGVGGSGENNGGSSGAGVAGSSSGGAAGSGQVSAGNPDEVVAAACGWEYRCCDAGERTFRMSPFAPDAATCTSRLTFQMRESNATANPHVAGSAAAGGLLGTLAYVVNLARVNVSASGVQECKDALDARGCATEPDPNARCAGRAPDDPCALTNLFEPKLPIGAECTAGLTEGGIYNDVECVAGSTCLPAAHEDNPNDVPTCVKRGLQSEPCTQDDDCDFNFFCSTTGSCTEKGDAEDTCSFNDPSEPSPGDENVQCKAGLSCNPATLKCVPSCTLGFVCATNSGDADLACPADSGCAPLEIAEATAAFRVCTALGNSAASLCNSDKDCVSTRYCDGLHCQSDKTNSANCAAQNECADGLHCDLGNTNTCLPNLAATTTCASDFQCGPSSAGCLNQGGGGFACRNSKLANAAVCGDDAACLSGRCEFANDAASERTCVAGAAVGANCDALEDNGDALTCAPGLLCFGDTGGAASGTCVRQASPGTNCDNPEGDPDNAMCANGISCASQWELDICTDGAVSKQNGGTGLTCDGS
ncbi:MAG: hypothetical protein RL033_852 [Pseudomonadota bacterium]